MLQQCSLNRLSESDFTHSDRQQVFQNIESSLTQDEIDPAEYVVENSQGPMADLVKILKVKTLPDGVKQDALIEDIFRSAIRIRLFHTNQSLNELRYLQEDNTDSNQENISYQEQVLMFIQLKQKLNIAIGTLSKIKS